jgi:hypothetical protein
MHRMGGTIQAQHGMTIWKPIFFWKFMQPMRRLGRLSVSPLGFERGWGGGEGGEGVSVPNVFPKFSNVF